MKVLITNDDGIHATGIQTLARAVAAVADVAVVAPEHERSATGHAITLHKPLRAYRTTIPDLEAPAWATNGTPADCVALGILDLLPSRPEMVLSGINVGPNIGSDLSYSGTVSGAMEGAIMGITSMAISVAAFEHIHYETAAEVAVRLVEIIARRSWPDDVLLNVNVPNLARDEVHGFAVTRQGTRRYISRLEKRQDPRGRHYYWLTGERAPAPDEEGSDAWALASGMVSVTPIQMDMTAVDEIPGLQRLLDEVALAQGSR